MSNSSRTLDDLLAISRPCRFCGVDEGVWCVVANGRTAGRTTPWLHQDRVELVQASHVLGYTSGRAAALAEILTEIDTAGARWSEIPRELGGEPALADVVAHIRKRHEIAKTWWDGAMDRHLAGIPASWRR